MVELNIEVDENDKVIGLRPREDFYTGKYIHRGAQLILRNSKGQILIQKRSQNKFRDPGKFGYAVTGTVTNESYEECIERETKEELGIDFEIEGSFILKYSFPHDRAFQKIFFATSDDPVTYQKNEIQSIERIDKYALRDDIIENPDKYAPTFIMGMKRYFDEFDRFGPIQES